MTVAISIGVVVAALYWELMHGGTALFKIAWKSGLGCLAFGVFVLFGADIRPSEAEWDHLFGVWAFLVAIMWIGRYRGVVGPDDE